MKKLLLSVTLLLLALMSFSQTSFAAITASPTKPHLSFSKQLKAWPTDVLVENYSRDSVTVRFITIVSDDTALLDPYPAAHYYAQLLHDTYSYQVRVMLWDYYGHLFYDQVVGSVKRITIYPASVGKNLSSKDVTIS